MSGPPAEPATASPASRRHAGRRSLAASASLVLVAATVAPLGSSHVKPAAAYTKSARGRGVLAFASRKLHPMRALSGLFHP